MCHSQLTLFVPEQATLLSFRLMPLDGYFFFFFFFFSYTFINLNIVLANYVVHVIHYILSVIKCKMSLQQISLLRNDILFLISLAHAKTKDGNREREKNKDGRYQVERVSHSREKGDTSRHLSNFVLCADCVPHTAAAIAIKKSDTS